MKLRDRGVSTVWAVRGPGCALVAATLAAAAAAPAVFAASEETAPYSFQAFVPGDEDQRLPAELRARSRSFSPPSANILTTARAVEIEWVGREGPGLRGYRLTAMIDGGPLSGFAARWMVAPGSGEQGALPGRTYRLRLPLPVDGRLRLHAALEAVRQDGSAVLLALHDSTPAPATADRWLSGPGWRGQLSSTSGGSALFQPAGAALASSGDRGIPDLRPERSLRDRGTPVSGQRLHTGRPRGPPAAAC
jgi:hypothetical protein